MTDRICPGVVLAIPAGLVNEFPRGTIVTRDKWTLVLVANVLVSKPGESDRVAHVFANAGETWHHLAARVRAKFPKPYGGEHVPHPEETTP